MDYDQLFAFAVFSEYLNFTHAAKELSISQPALHAKIRRLIDDVGLPLYIREGRSLKLTAEGRKLAAYGRDVRAHGRRVLAEIRGEDSIEPLVLAAGRGALRYLLADAIAAYSRLGIGSPLRIASMNGPATQQAIVDGRADVGVLVNPSPVRGLHARTLARVSQVAIVPKDHSLGQMKSLRIKQLRDEPLILSPKGQPHRRMLDEVFHAANITPNIAVEVDGWELMLQLAQSGFGIAIVNDFCPPPTGFTAIPLRGLPHVDYQVLYRPMGNQDARTKLAEHLLACA